MRCRRFGLTFFGIYPTIIDGSLHFRLCAAGARTPATRALPYLVYDSAGFYCIRYHALCAIYKWEPAPIRKDCHHPEVR